MLPTPPPSAVPMLLQFSGPESGPPGPPGPVKRFLQRVPRRWILGFLAVVVTAIAGNAVVARVTKVEPEDVVRDYLEAIRERKVTTALRIAGVARPNGDAGAFLTAPAMSRDWRVGDVISEWDDYDHHFTVTASLVLTRGTFDGTWAGFPMSGTDESTKFRTLTGEFTVLRRGGRYRITNPFVGVIFPASPVQYLEVNGVRLAPRPTRPEPDRYSGTALPTHYLFPGFYTLYGSANNQTTKPGGRPEPEVIITTEHLLAPPGAGLTKLDGATFEVTPRGVQTVQRAVSAAVDSCIAEYNKPGAGCQFSVEYRSGLRYRGQYYGLMGAENPRWRVVAYPVLNKRVQLTSGSSFGLHSAVPGVLHLTVDAHRDGSPGPLTTVTQTCIARGVAVTSAIAPDGSVTTGWSERPDDRAPTSGARRISLECYS